MKILTISNLYPPHAYGGYEWTCYDAMQIFAAAGHEVTVLTSDAEVPGAAAGAEPGVHRTLQPWWDWARQAPHHFTKRERLAIARRNHRVLVGAIEETQPDMVSVWHMGGMGLNLLTEVERRDLPMVVMIEDDWLIYGPGIDIWTRTFRSRRTLGRLATAVTGVPTSPPGLNKATIVFASAYTKDKAAAQSHYAVRAAQILPLGVDTHHFPLTAPEPKPWEWRILYVGRMAPQKGIETLARSFAQLPSEARLQYIGAGDEGYRPTFLRLLAKLGIEDRIELAAAPRSELADRYRSADLVVFPSEWDEPFGLVPLEAMACGAPLIATGTGGSSEFLVDGENCRLYPPGDVSRLTATILELAADPALRQHIAAGGHRTAQRLTVDRFADRLLAIHETICAAATHAAHKSS